MTSFMTDHPTELSIMKSVVKINTGKVTLTGELALPINAKGIVLFVHGSGSSRHSKRNQYVASVLQSSGMATLLFDLLTDVEEKIDSFTYHLRFDIYLLSERLMEVTRWVKKHPKLQDYKIAYFGASTGAAAALEAAAKLGDSISAVVSRGGRPDLARNFLNEVKCPTLFIVGSFDEDVMSLNEYAANLMRCENQIKVIEGASHLFEEPGKLEEVASVASVWLSQRLKG